jgi:hypothetical protein
VRCCSTLVLTNTQTGALLNDAAAKARAVTATERWCCAAVDEERRCWWCCISSCADPAAGESAEALEQVSAVDVDVARQSWCCRHTADAAAQVVADMLLLLTLELKLLQHWKLKPKMLLPSLARRRSGCCWTLKLTLLMSPNASAAVLSPIPNIETEADAQWPLSSNCRSLTLQLKLSLPSLQMQMKSLRMRCAEWPAAVAAQRFRWSCLADADVANVAGAERLLHRWADVGDAEVAEIADDAVITSPILTSLIPNMRLLIGAATEDEGDAEAVSLPTSRPRSSRGKLEAHVET